MTNGKKNLPSKKEDDQQDKELSGSEKAKIAAGFSAANSAQKSTIAAREKFKKPSEYTGNRKLYDDGAAKAHAKARAFQDGEVYDPYSGDRLVLRKQEAKAQYGDDWTSHLAEADHVKPLEKIHEEGKKNPWLTSEDVKTAANSDDNLKVVSRKTNNAKRSRTNKDFAEDEAYRESKGVTFSEEGKQAAIRDGEIAEKSIDRQLFGSAAKNVVKTGHQAGMDAAKSAGSMTAVMSGITNLVAVIRGEKDLDDAIADTAIDTGKATVSGYVTGNGLTVIQNSLTNVNSPFIKALTESNVPGKIITAVVMIGSTLKKYGDGEISTDECLIELGDKGLTTLTAGYSMIVGQTLIPIPVIGAAIGALVGSMLTSNYYHNLINSLQQKRFEHQERLRIIEECEAAAEQAKAYRQELEKYLDEYFKDYQNCFDDALSLMAVSFRDNDADGMIAGANQITRKLGGRVNYETVDEFTDFLFSAETDIL